MLAYTCEKAFSERREPPFHPRDFTVLSNYQAIVIPYDGSRPLTASGLLPELVVEQTESVRGTGSGTTTLLNALVSLLPARGRVISIEDTLDLRLRRANRLRFVTDHPRIPTRGH